MAKRDYYEILGVAKTAADGEIKTAYRKLAVQYHPDKNPNNPEAEEKFKEASEAYTILSDANQRAQYDRFGHAGVGGAAGAGAGWGGAGYINLEDVLGDLFGFAGGFGAAARSGAAARANSAQRGSDLRYDLEMTLEEAAEGKTAQINVPRLETCDECAGKGAEPGTQAETCTTCNGAGQVSYQQGFFAVARTCGTCRGKGQIIKTPCKNCRGAGRIEREKTLEVKIPAGVETGSRLRVQGEGEAGVNGGGRGDLFVVLHVEEHDDFERQAENLYTAKPISFAQAALGSEVAVKTLYGEEKLKVPAGTQTGTIFKIKGQGMPILGAGGRRGDLYVAANVMTPTTLSKDQRKLLEQLAQVEDRDFAKDAGFMDKVRSFFS